MALPVVSVSSSEIDGSYGVGSEITIDIRQVLHDSLPSDSTKASDLGYGYGIKKVPHAFEGVYI